MASAEASQELASSGDSILRNREFMLVWGAGSLLWLARVVEWFVLALLVREFTDSSFLVALVSALYWLPMLPMSIFSGVITDRLERWRLLILAHVVTILVTVVLLMLIGGDQIQPWHIYVGVLVLGGSLTMDWTARGAFMFDLVGPRNVVRAMSMQSVGFAAGSLIGPVVSGYLLELAGFSGPYFFLLGVYILALALMLVVRSRSRGVATSSESPWQGALAGVRYGLGNPLLLGAVSCMLIINFMGTSAFALYPIIGRDFLGVGPGLTGLLLSVQGIGSLIGAISLAIIGWFAYMGRVFVLACASWMAALVGFALSPWYPMSLVLMLIVGVCLGAYFALQISLVLLAAEPEMRGRALGLAGMTLGITPLGTFMIGGVANALGTPTAMAINGGAGLLLFIPIVLLTPLARRTLTRGDRSTAVAIAGDS